MFGRGKRCGLGAGTPAGVHFAEGGDLAGGWLGRSLRIKSVKAFCIVIKTVFVICQSN